MTSDFETQLDAISDAARWQVALDLRDELAGTLRARQHTTTDPATKAGLDTQLAELRARVQATDRDSADDVAELVDWLTSQLQTARERSR